MFVYVNTFFVTLWQQITGEPAITSPKGMGNTNDKQSLESP